MTTRCDRASAETWIMSGPMLIEKSSRPIIPSLARVIAKWFRWETRFAFNFFISPALDDIDVMRTHCDRVITGSCLLFPLWSTAKCALMQGSKPQKFSAKLNAKLNEKLNPEPLDFCSKSKNLITFRGSERWGTRFCEAKRNAEANCRFDSHLIARNLVTAYCGVYRNLPNCLKALLVTCLATCLVTLVQNLTHFVLWLELTFLCTDKLLI